jgi:hypothetical protein
LTASSKELADVVAGVIKRLEAMELDPAEFLKLVAVDNCCQIENDVRAVAGWVDLVLDLFHFVVRYTDTIANKTKNPAFSAVGRAVVEAISFVSPDHQFRQFYPKEEQAKKLETVYNQYATRGTIWTAESLPTHRNQIQHVLKGCLQRSSGNENLRADTTLTENTNRWTNQVQSGAASGLTVYNTLLHDFVLRRNVRMMSKLKATPFIQECEGSHHLSLVHKLLKARMEANEEAELKRRLLLYPSTSPQSIAFPDIKSGEHFGFAATMSEKEYVHALSSNFLKTNSTSSAFQVLKIEPQDEIDFLVNEHPSFDQFLKPPMLPPQNIVDLTSSGEILMPPPQRKRPIGEVIDLENSPNKVQR